MDIDQVWKAVLGELEVVLSQANFGMWFKDSFIYDIKDGKAIIASHNAFTRDWIKDRYSRQILLALKKQLPEVKEVDFKVATKDGTTPRTINIPSPEPVVKKEKNPNTLSPQYTFENFVIGNTNKFAAASAKAVAEKTGQLHNPLFIYGGVGLGKTHLAQAVGNEIQKKYRNKKVVYVTCETFTNDFVTSISSGKMKEFKKNYREVDVLIVDDIQFLANKEGSQEEFFHTYNTLHQTNRQIIITADRTPQKITALEERLASRFGSGLMTDIQPPDLETRLAILKNKSEILGVKFNEDVLLYIAQNIRSNVRELTGALNKIGTHAQLYREDPTIALCDELLRDNFTPISGNASVEKIIKAISIHYNIPITDILGRKRQKDLVCARQIAMYLLRHELNLSHPLVGKELGGRDHTTCMYGADKIEKQLSKDSKLKNEVISIRERIHSV